jgi:chromosome partitioning protein
MPENKLKVLAVLNHKGGVGKTTLSKLLVEYFVRRGKRVLGIDIDPQANFSARFIDMDPDEGIPPNHPDFNPNDPIWDELVSPPPGYWSIAQLFRLGYVVPYSTQYENLDFIPSHKDELNEFLQAVDKAQIEDAVIEQLKLVLSDEYYQEEYDIVVIDTPPQISALNASVVRAATDIIIPTELQEDSLTGVSHMAQLWASENMHRQKGEAVNLVGVLPTKVQDFAPQRDSLQALKDTPLVGEKIIEPVMRMLGTYQTASSSYADPASLFDIHESNAARKEAEAFCAEIYRRIWK